MSSEVLSNKPLVEAIFQLRWRLEGGDSEPPRDPHYRLLVGSLYDKLAEEYPYHEELPTADLPDELVPYVVQHRFRAAEEDWPLVQIGPGILSLNETDHYVWADFQGRALSVVEALYDSHPDGQELQTDALTLRYIDAVGVDEPQQSPLDFLKAYLKTDIGLEAALFEDTGVLPKPTHLDLRFSFPSTQPLGSVHMRFSLGHAEREGSILWETVVESRGADVPSDPSGVTSWLAAAHDLTHDWFFKLIEGDLRERFT
jgi:uncharacterized protein (TIGR04255 family)